MHLTGTPILLLGPTTTLGHELLLRLAVVGFEVIAYAPEGDDGRTGEFACVLATDHDAFDYWHAGASLVVDAQTEAGRCVLVRDQRETRRFPHAPLIGDVTARVRSSSALALMKDPWSGRALPVIHEREVAQLVVEAVVKELPGTELGGPDALTWRDVVLFVRGGRARRAFLPHLAGRWPVPEHPRSLLDDMARYPRVGRRSLSDALMVGDAAAPVTQAPARSGALSIPRL
jgi:hypothetical protein